MKLEEKKMKNKKYNLLLKNLVRDCFYNCIGLDKQTLLSINDELKDLVIITIMNLRPSKDVLSDPKIFHLFQDLEIFLESSKLNQKIMGNIPNSLLRIVHEKDLSQFRGKGGSLMIMALFYILAQWETISTKEYTYRVLGDIVDVCDKMNSNFKSYSELDIKDLYTRIESMREIS